LSLALKLAKNYDVGDYTRSRLVLAEEELNTLFEKEEDQGTQVEISDYFVRA
jgi:DNA polymerase II large subunit